MNTKPVIFLENIRLLYGIMNYAEAYKKPGLV